MHLCSYSGTVILFPVLLYCSSTGWFLSGKCCLEQFSNLRWPEMVNCNVFWWLRAPMKFCFSQIWLLWLYVTRKIFNKPYSNYWWLYVTGKNMHTYDVLVTSCCVLLLSGNLFGYLQRPRTNLLCPVTIVTNLSGHNRHHMKPYDWVREKHMHISGMDMNVSGTLS